MKASTYPGALSAAAPVVASLDRQASLARSEGDEEIARMPGTRAIEALIDVAFWASFRREEGRPPQISLAWLPPDDAARPLQLANRFPLTPELLARLSPAVERPGVHLGVWEDDGQYYLWGMTRRIPPLCLVVEVVQPGLLVVKRRRRRSFGKFANIAVLEGDVVKVIDDEYVRNPDCPPVLASLLGYSPLSGGGLETTVLVRLSTGMRAHGHGGALIIVPSGSDRWRRSIVWPVRYLIEPSFDSLHDAMEEVEAPGADAPMSDQLRGAIEAVAGLTAVDGATIVDSSFRVLAFGAKLNRARGSHPVEHLTMTEPVRGVSPTIVHPSDVGGTRHLSAAQFVHDEPAAQAFVSSQDGRFTVFTWSGSEEMVHARKIEALLL